MWYKNVIIKTKLQANNDKYGFGLVIIRSLFWLPRVEKEDVIFFSCQTHHLFVGTRSFTNHSEVTKFHRNPLRGLSFRVCIDSYMKTSTNLFLWCWVKMKTDLDEGESTNLTLGIIPLLYSSYWTLLRIKPFYFLIV